MLAPLAMASASSPWPQASWKSVPPNPLASTTGMAPTGAGLLSSMMVAFSAAVRATRRAMSSSTSSNPALPPTVSWPVWMTSPRRATTWAMNRVRVRSS